MVRICSIQIIEKILNVIKRNRKNNCIGHYNEYSYSGFEHTTNNYFSKKIHYQGNIKERIARLIKKSEKYFIYEAMRTTADTILYDDYRDVQRLKTLGYSHRIAAEIFEKYGIFLYVTDLSTYIYAPDIVKYELQNLIKEYGLDKVSEEIAIYLMENYSHQFGIKIVCTP